MTLDPKIALEAEIFAREDGVPYRGRTWPTKESVAVILCPSCGDLDKTNQLFSLFGEPGDGRNRCVECKGLGYLFVGL